MRYHWFGAVSPPVGRTKEPLAEPLTYGLVSEPKKGCVWVSCFGQDEFIRVYEGGDIAERVAVPGKRAVACMLGGEDRKTLFLLTAETTLEELAQGKSKGRIETVRVDVPGAGYP